MKDRLGIYLMRWRIRTVLPHVRGRLLDVGCGTNSLVRAYAGEGIGVDVYPWEGVNLVVEDTAVLPFADGSFDTVTIVAALNHIPNRAAVLAEAWRLLGPGGRLLVTMIPPTVSRLWYAVREPWDSDQRERGMVEGEVFGLPPGQMRQLLVAAGFRVEREIPFMARLNRLYIASRPTP